MTDYRRENHEQGEFSFAAVSERPNNSQTLGKLKKNPYGPNGSLLSHLHGITEALDLRDMFFVLERPFQRFDFVIAAFREVCYGVMKYTAVFPV